MNDAYKAEVSKVLAMLASAFRDKPDDLLLETWVLVLTAEKVTTVEMRQAMLDVLKSRVYQKIPTPAEFLSHIRHTEKDLVATAELQADVVMNTARRLWVGQKPTWEDPITAYLMSHRWPWRDFIESIDRMNVVWWRKDFCGAYCQMSAAGLPPAGPALPASTIKQIAEHAEGRVTPPGTPEAREGVESIGQVLRGSSPRRTVDIEARREELRQQAEALKEKEA